MTINSTQWQVIAFTFESLAKQFPRSMVSLEVRRAVGGQIRYIAGIGDENCREWGFGLTPEQAATDARINAANGTVRLGQIAKLRAELAELEARMPEGSVESGAPTIEGGAA